MGIAFWCFFWKLAALKAYVDSASLWCPAVLRLRKPPTKNTIFPQHRQPPSCSQIFCTKPRRRSPLCASFERQPHNWVPKSHEITNVNRHITYLSGKMTLTEFCWVLLIKHAFCRSAMLKDVKFWLLTTHFNISLAFLIFNTSKVTYCKMISFFFIKPSRFQIACGFKSVHIYNNYYKVSFMSSQSK